MWFYGAIAMIDLMLCYVMCQQYINEQKSDKASTLSQNRVCLRACVRACDCALSHTHSSLLAIPIE